MGLFESKIAEEKEDIIVTDSEFTDQEQRMDFTSDEEPTPSVNRRDLPADNERKPQDINDIVGQTGEDSGINAAINTDHDSEVGSEIPGNGDKVNNDTITPSVIEAHKLESVQLVPTTTEPTTPILPTDTAKESNAIAESQAHNLQDTDEAILAANVSKSGANHRDGEVSETPGSPVDSERRECDQSDVHSEMTHSDMLSSQDDTFDSEMDDDSRSMLAKFITDKNFGK